MPPLILASTSRYRRELLSRLGLPFDALPPACDEEALKAGIDDPCALARHLAEAKAASIAAARPEAVVIGSDQVCALGAEVLHKAGSIPAAEAQLARLAGRTHRLITAVAVIHPHGIRRHVDLTTLTMRPLSAEAIRRYVAADRPIDCAGSYKLECRGIALFSAIDSRDHSAITGLPLLWLTGVLADLGFPVP